MLTAPCLPGAGGSEIFFDGTYVTAGTTPAGSAWAQNPIPLVSGDDGLPEVLGICPRLHLLRTAPSPTRR